MRRADHHDTLRFDGRELIDPLPQECIDDCSAPGRDASEAVDYWRKRLNFSPPRAHAVEFLRGYGAWDDLETASDTTIAERVLWLFSGNAREAQFNGDEPIYYLGD